MDDRTEKRLDPKRDSNPDPITGKPGAHPIGVAGGGIGGALAGAAIGGAVGGPIGAVAGGTIGAVAGGLGGKAAAESVNPTEEETYWRGSYASRPYVKKGADYSEYAPAYRYGWESAANPEYRHRAFADVEPDLQRNWSTYRRPAQSEWRDVREATRESFDRVRARTTAK
jgi:hypothetical protein